MTTRAEIIAEARTWRRTPWRHQGRLKGIACDCVGFIVGVPVALGIFPCGFDINGYPREGDWQRMRSVLDNYLDRVELRKMTGGDVLWLRVGRIPQHLAIFTFDGTIIHAVDPNRGVTEHILNDRWFSAIVGVWSYRGLDD